MNNYDDDIRILMRRDSVVRQLFAFALAAVYGFVSGGAAIKVRGFVLNVARIIIYTADIEAAQYMGLMQMWEIGTIVVLVAAWLTTVLVAWQRIGKQDSLPRGFLVCGVWCACAAAVYAIFHIISNAM